MRAAADNDVVLAAAAGCKVNLTCDDADATVDLRPAALTQANTTSDKTLTTAEARQQASFTEDHDDDTREVLPDVADGKVIVKFVACQLLKTVVSSLLNL